jgi:hypothetical protein
MKIHCVSILKQNIYFGVADMDTKFIQKQNKKMKELLYD